MADSFRFARRADEKEEKPISRDVLDGPRLERRFPGTETRVAAEEDVLAERRVAVGVVKLVGSGL